MATNKSGTADTEKSKSTRLEKQATHEKIRNALQKLKTESNGRELELIDLVASIYESVKDSYDSVIEAKDAAIDKVIETKDKAIEKTQDAVITMNNSVHAHPWHYIGGAAVVGFLTGLWCRRR